ncbi:oligosaccharide flippase family protein [Candidatus Kaiserbacteria bacterium]|nr:oligosaccharide flippase family protein [Candidatus Kaiserbacteria bacterium]
MIQKLRNKTYRFLRWTETYARTDMLYLVKGGSWLTLGQGAGTLTGLVLAIGFANLLPKEVYGNYTFILALAGIVGTFTLTGMRSAITRAVAKGFDGMLQVGFRESMKWSILMVIAALAGALYYFFNKNNVLGISLLIVGTFSPLMISAALYSGFLNGKKDFKTGTIFNIYTNAIPAVFLLPTIFFTHNIIIIVFVYFVSHTAVNVFFYAQTLKKYEPEPDIDVSTITYSKHLSLMNVLSTVADYLDKILVFHYLGAAQLAIYAFAIAVPTQLRGLLRNINSLLLPKFAEGEKKTIQKSLYGKVLRVALISSVFVGAYIVVAPFIYQLFFPQYLDSVFYSQLFSLIIIPATMSIVSSSFLEAQREQKLLYIINITSPLIRIGLLLVLGYFYGIIGIILAVVISKTISFFMIAILARKA